MGVVWFALYQCRQTRTVPLSAAYGVTKRLVVVLVANARQRRMDERSTVRVYSVAAPTKVQREGSHVCFAEPSVAAPFDIWYQGPEPPVATCSRVCFNNLSDEDATGAVAALLRLAATQHDPGACLV